MHGMWRNAIPDLLQWAALPLAKGKLRLAERSRRVPTWSWASLDNAVGYPDDLEPNITLRSELEVVAVHADAPALVLKGFLMDMNTFEGRQLGIRESTQWYYDVTPTPLRKKLHVLLLLSSNDMNEDSEHWDYDLGAEMKEIDILLRWREKGFYTREGVGIRRWRSRNTKPKSHETWAMLRTITIR